MESPTLKKIMLDLNNAIDGVLTRKGVLVYKCNSRKVVVFHQLYETYFNASLL